MKKEIYMSNKEIYRRTLVFSLKKLGFDVLSVVLLAALSVGGFFLMDKFTDKGLIGLAIGIVVAIVAIAIISRFVSYNIKAGQIAMMMRGVVDGELPDDVYGEGKRMVKERFTTVAVYFAATRVIKGIFNQIGRLITKIGDSIGGDVGGAVGSAVSSAVQTIVAYLCDCCLAWVFFRKEQSSARATCEGAVLFFRHGKTLAKNVGRIFGIGIASLIVIGGAFFGIFYLIFSAFPAAFESLAKEIAEAGTRIEGKIPEFLTDPATLTIVIAAIGGVIVWGILHSTFVRPFILTGVLRNYIESGVDDIPSESAFAELSRKSSKFAKLQAEI